MRNQTQKSISKVTSYLDLPGVFVFSLNKKMHFRKHNSHGSMLSPWPCRCHILVSWPPQGDTDMFAPPPRKYHCQIIPICHCWWKSSHLRWIRMDDLRATVWITSSVEIPKEYHWTPSTHPHDMRWFIGRYVFQDFSPGSMDDKKALLNPLMNYPQR